MRETFGIEERNYVCKPHDHHECYGHVDLRDQTGHSSRCVSSSTYNGSVIRNRKKKEMKDIQPEYSTIYRIVQYICTHIHICIYIYIIWNEQKTFFANINQFRKKCKLMIVFKLAMDFVRK